MFIIRENIEVFEAVASSSIFISDHSPMSRSAEDLPDLRKRLLALRIRSDEPRERGSRRFESAALATAFPSNNACVARSRETSVFLLGWEGVYAVIGVVL